MKNLNHQVKVASQRLRGRATRTPIFTSRTLDKLIGRQVFLKGECLQRTGSFKFRGALNALLQLPRDVKSVVTHSSGNHGQALAAAAQELGLTCTVVVPSTCAQVKINAMRETYGAHVVLCEPTQAARCNTAAKLAQQMSAAMIPPYNSEAVICGQGTIGLEMMDQVSELDAIIVPTSGGGMLAGIAAAVVPSGIKVFAVEPQGKRLGEALKSKQRVAFPHEADKAIDTICDAMPTMAIGEVPWPIVEALVEPTVLTVDDDEVLAGMRFAFRRLKLVIEPAAAAGLAALIGGQVERLGSAEKMRRIGVVLCGGNVSDDFFTHCLRE